LGHGILYRNAPLGGVGQNEHCFLHGPFELAGVNELFFGLNDFRNIDGSFDSHVGKNKG
jgi:hypothetical protein